MHEREKYLLKKELDEVVAVLRQCNAMLAGEAVTSLFTDERVRDWDLYFRNVADRDLAIKLFTEKGQLTFQTDTAKTFKFGQRKKPFQIICMPELMGQPSDIFDSFDFTVCMGLFDFAADEFVLHDDFLKHLAQRKLVVHVGTRFPICSLLRVLKYQRRGFKISGVDMMKLALAVHRVELNTFKDLRRQMMGIDTAFLMALTDRFKEGEAAEKPYRFDEFMEMVDEYMRKAWEPGDDGREEEGS